MSGKEEKTDDKKEDGNGSHVDFQKTEAAFTKITKAGSSTPKLPSEITEDDRRRAKEFSEQQARESKANASKITFSREPTAEEAAIDAEMIQHHAEMTKR